MAQNAGTTRLLVTEDILPLLQRSPTSKQPFAHTTSRPSSTTPSSLENACHPNPTAPLTVPLAPYLARFTSLRGFALARRELPPPLSAAAGENSTDASPCHSLPHRTRSPLTSAGRRSRLGCSSRPSRHLERLALSFSQPTSRLRITSPCRDLTSPQRSQGTDFNVSPTALPVLPEISGDSVTIRGWDLYKLPISPCDDILACRQRSIHRPKTGRWELSRRRSCTLCFCSSESDLLGDEADTAADTWRSCRYAGRKSVHNA